MNIGIIGVLGFLIAFSGHLGGTLFTFTVKNKGERFRGGLLGFTAGILIAFVCFELLPEAFEQSNLWIGVLGMIAGVIFSAFMEGRINFLKSKFDHNYNFKYIKAGILMCVGISIHHLPEGMAVGSLLHVSFLSGMKMAIIIALHCFPEAFAVVLPLKAGGISSLKIIFLIFILSIPMGIGSAVGALLSGISPLFIAFSLSLAGGVMLYITCGEIIPESKDIWKGRLSTVGSLVGFIIGVIITAKI